jgi:Ca2+-dependent lipid-binding protein
MIHSILGPMMYEPNVFTLNIEQLLSGAPVDAAIGVIKVTVSTRAISRRARLVAELLTHMLVSVSTTVTELAKTKYKDST